MSTEGAYGFRVNNQDKLTRSLTGSYPTNLGYRIADFVRTTSKADLRTIAEKVQLVSRKSTPTAEQKKTYKGYANTSVSSGSLNEWRVLLYKTQGALGVYKGILDILIDDNDFVRDSLWCEWAYVIDVDTDTLEIYRGSQTKLDPNGRYTREFAKERLPEGTEALSKYTGVALVQSLPNGVLRALKESRLSELFAALSGTLELPDYSGSGEGFDDPETARKKLDALLATPPRDTVLGK